MLPHFRFISIKKTLHFIFLNAFSVRATKAVYHCLSVLDCDWQMASFMPHESILPPNQFVKVVSRELGDPSAVLLSSFFCPFFVPFLSCSVSRIYTYNTNQFNT